MTGPSVRSIWTTDASVNQALPTRQNGDILCVWGLADDVSPPTPTGVGTLVSQASGNAQGVRYNFWTREIDGSEGNISIVVSGADAAWGVFTVQDAASSFIDAGPVTANGASGSAYVAPGLTTLIPDALLVNCIGLRAAGGGQIITPPGGQTEHADTGGDWAASGVFSEPRPTPGATGTRTYTVSSGPFGWVAMSISFAPAPSDEPAYLLMEDGTVILTEGATSLILETP